MSPIVLGQALALLPPQHDPRLLVDTSTADDAGVYQLTEEIALVQTVDFLPPACGSNAIETTVCRVTLSRVGPCCQADCR